LFAASVDAIKSLGDQNALPLITPLLNDSDSYVRSSAVIVYWLQIKQKKDIFIKKYNFILKSVI